MTATPTNAGISDLRFAMMPAPAPLDEVRLRQCLDRIAGMDHDVRRELGRIGYPPPRQRPPGFATLAQIIVAQQVSTKAAATVWKRIRARSGGEVSPERLMSMGEAPLRECGLSGRKAGYLLGLASDAVYGHVVIDALPALDTELAIAELTRIRGFGTWSAEIYLLFALGREDVFPANDLALQHAFQRLKSLECRPDPVTLRNAVGAWLPFRGAGAVFLWHLYGSATLSDGK